MELFSRSQDLSVPHAGAGAWGRDRIAPQLNTCGAARRGAPLQGNPCET